jgi:hypothetical protein
MCGTLRGKIDCWTNSGSQFTNAQAIFKGLYDFLKSHPNMTEIARNGGLGGSASNINYYDEADPFSHNAWYVFRMNDATLESGDANPTGYSGSRTYPWYIYVQFGRGDVGVNWNASPATPSVHETSSSLNSNTGAVICQFCIPVGTIAGTSEAPWNGSGTLGTNTKGDPVWRTTAGNPTGFQGSYVFPRTNGPGGSYSSSRQSSSTIVYAYNNGSPIRYSFIADDDSLVILTNIGDNANDWVLTYFGRYNVRPGITMDYPMVHLQGGLPLGVNNTIYGPTNGAYPGGGIPMNAVATDGVRQVIISRYREFFNQYSSPNRMFSTEKYDEWKIPVIAYETPTFFGYAGDIEFLQEVYNWSPNDMTTGRLRASWGADTPFGIKLTTPWDGSSSPRSNFNRAGISFP